ncbi:MAG: putative selenate ABC transporter substrate-binding protein [Pseudomonadota bacterium]
MTIFNRMTAALAALLLFGTPTTVAGAGPIFTFTAIPDENETRLNERFGKVAVYLGKALGVETKFVPVKSYPAAVTAFRNNDVQLAWFGGLTGVQARRAVPGSQAIAQGAEDVAFISYFIANTSTGLRASTKSPQAFPKGITGRSFTFGAKTSTSGRLIPEYWIRKQLGVAPAAAFTRIGFSGDHSKTLELVQSGAYEIGALNYSVWRNEVQAGHVDAQKVRVIWQTPGFPDYQWTIRGDVDTAFGKGFTKKVQKSLVGMNDKSLLDSFERTAFIKASNKDYAPIEKTAKEIGLLDE